MNAVQARYENGVLSPLEPLDLEEGAEVRILVENAPRPEPAPAAPGENDAVRKVGMAAIIERVKERHKDVSEEAWAKIPTDYARNHKHYLYGHPKEED